MYHMLGLLDLSFGAPQKKSVESHRGPQVLGAARGGHGPAEAVPPAVGGRAWK